MKTGKPVGRPKIFEQTPQRVFENTYQNLWYKKEKGLISEIEYKRGLTNAKIKLLEAKLNKIKEEEEVKENE